jgi:ankyrin repeat protein
MNRRACSALFLLAALAAGSPGYCDPIHDAAREGDVKKVESLLKANPALVSSKDGKYGQTPLHVAAFNDRLEVAKLLIDNKADVNSAANNGSTPLHLAAAKGNKDIVNLLLANNANINAVDHDGWSPLHSSVIWQHKDIEDLLRQHGGEDPLVPKPAAAAQPAEKVAPKETGKDGQFTAFSDGTVLDTKTNLMWTARDNGNGLSWLGAKSYAGSYHGSGYSDWQLPTVAELTTLLDKTKSHKSFCPAAVDELGAAADDVHTATELIHLSCTRIWTSQERAEKPGFATIFDFHSGSDTARPDSKDFVDTASRVLLVRAGK